MPQVKMRVRIQRPDLEALAHDMGVRVGAEFFETLESILAERSKRVSAEAARCQEQWRKREEDLAAREHLGPGLQWIQVVESHAHAAAESVLVLAARREVRRGPLRF